MKDIKVVNVCSMKEASSIVVGIGINWSKNMCSNSTYMIWYMQHKRLKLFKLTWIGAKVLVMDLTYTLSLISSSKEKKKNTSYKCQVQPRKMNELNMHEWETWDLWTLRNPNNSEMSDSWAWNIRNEYYGES